MPCLTLPFHHWLWQNLEPVFTWWCLNHCLLCSGVDLSQNMGFRVSQVKTSNCFQVAREKMVLPSISTQVFRPWWCETCAYPTLVLNARLSFLGGQNILWPLLHIFRGSGPQPPWSTPLVVRVRFDCALTTVRRPAENNRSPQPGLLFGLPVQDWTLWLYRALGLSLHYPIQSRLSERSPAIQAVLQTGHILLLNGADKSAS